MPQQLNAKEVKEKIKNFLDMVGPSLPVQVAKHMQMNSIFASAFLSEMISDNTVKITNMKVGGSPLYYTPQKLPMLENFISSLGRIEKEAANLLKEKGILEDSQQTPAIRVALRSLKDFAFPFKNNNAIFWRYFLVSEEEVKLKLEPNNLTLELTSEKEKSGLIKPILKETTHQSIIETPEKIEDKSITKVEEIIKTEIKVQEPNKLQELEQQILEKEKELEKTKQQLAQLNENKTEFPFRESKKEKIKKIKVVKPKENEFLTEIKEILSKKKVEILSIEKIDKREIFARVRLHDGDYLLAAFNKKKVEDSDLLKAYKKSLILGLPYYILSKGEPSKKTKEAIEAHKKLTSIEKIENESNLAKNTEQ